MRWILFSIVNNIITIDIPFPGCCSNTHISKFNIHIVIAVFIFIGIKFNMKWWAFVVGFKCMKPSIHPCILLDTNWISTCIWWIWHYIRCIRIIKQTHSICSITGIHAIYRAYVWAIYQWISRSITYSISSCTTVASVNKFVSGFWFIGIAMCMY